MKDPRATITTPLLAGATYFDLLALLDEKCKAQGVTDYLIVSNKGGGIAAVPIPKGAELVHVKRAEKVDSEAWERPGIEILEPKKRGSK